MDKNAAGKVFGGCGGSFRRVNAGGGGVMRRRDVEFHSGEGISDESWS